MSQPWRIYLHDEPHDEIDPAFQRWPFDLATLKKKAEIFKEKLTQADSPEDYADLFAAVDAGEITEPVVIITNSSIDEWMRPYDSIGLLDAFIDFVNAAKGYDLERWNEHCESFFCD